MIHTLFDKHRLEGAPNFRDLGGLPAADGRHIRYGRLLRCGHLSYITPADGQTLLNDYSLQTVVDLRTSREMARRPDTELPGVTYVHCPIFEQPAEGVTRENESDYDPIASAIEMAERMEGDAHGHMAELYKVFFEEEGIRHYREFFDVLLGQTEGSVLWHCTMGKDRCGTAAILTETALGVPADLILADYLYTNDRLQDITADKMAQGIARGATPELMEQLRIMDSVHEDYFKVITDCAEALSGSLLQFVQEQLGMTGEKLARLREMYFE